MCLYGAVAQQAELRRRPLNFAPLLRQKFCPHPRPRPRPRRDVLSNLAAARPRQPPCVRAVCSATMCIGVCGCEDPCPSESGPCGCCHPGRPCAGCYKPCTERICPGCVGCCLSWDAKDQPCPRCKPNPRCPPPRCCRCGCCSLGVSQARSRLRRGHWRRPGAGRAVPDARALLLLCGCWGPAHCAPETAPGPAHPRAVARGAGRH